MVNHNTAPTAPTQAPPGAPSQEQLAELWDEYTKDASVCVAAASRPVLDDPEPIGWDATGIDHLGLRRIVRAVHQSDAGIVETIWIKNYPGLRAAIPARGLTRRPGFAGGDRRIGDDDLCQKFTLAIHGRGRGMRDRGLALVRELCEARCLGVGYFERKDAVNESPARFTPAERAAITRNPLSGTQWRILEYLAFARGRMGKLGLWGPSANWGRIFGVDEKTIRRAMAGLESLSLAWRHYTPCEGTGGRRVDQGPNLLLPGPAWLRVDAMWTGDDDGGVVREHWGDVARMRNCEQRERDNHRRACRRAQAAGESLPVPRGGYPLEFETWARERIGADATLRGVKDRLELLDARSGDVPASDAQAIATGQRSPIEAYELGQENRNAARDALAGERKTTMSPTTPEALDRSSGAVEAIRAVPDSELHQVAGCAKVASVNQALYSRKGADILPAPSQAKSFGHKGGGADASPPPVASLVADLRRSLTSRFGDAIKPRDWRSTGDRERWGTERVLQGHTPPAPGLARLVSESSAVPSPLVGVVLPNAIKEGVQSEGRAGRPPVDVTRDSPGPHQDFTISHFESRRSPAGVPNRPATTPQDGIPSAGGSAGRNSVRVDLVRGEFGKSTDGIPYVDIGAELLRAAKGGNSFAARFFLGLRTVQANNPDKKE